MNENDHDPNDVWSPLKPLDQVLELDRRVITGRKLPPPLDRVLPASVRQHHAAISALDLPKAVPVDIRQLWDVARNLYLYSMFYFRFQDIARLQGSAAIECALRAAMQIVPNKEGRLPGLRQLLRHAISSQRIRLSGFGWWRRRAVARQATDGQSSISEGLPSPVESHTSEEKRFLEHLLHHIPLLRDEFAHGTNALLGTSLEWMEVMRDLILQLFDSNLEKAPDPQ